MTGLPQSYWLKIANFFHPPLSFSTLAGGDPFWIYEKALRILKLESSDGEDVLILACTIFDWSTHVTDRQNYDG